MGGHRAPRSFASSVGHPARTAALRAGASDGGELGLGDARRGYPGEAGQSGAPAPGRSWSRKKMWLAALPLFVGYTLAAITMNAALAPASQDHEELRLERSPAVAPPAAPPVQFSPSHREEIVFDPSEMISV